MATNSATKTYDETDWRSDRSGFLTPTSVAMILGVKTTTLSEWRSRGVGPAFTRLSQSAVRYPKDAFVDWLDARTETPEG